MASMAFASSPGGSGHHSTDCDATLILNYNVAIQSTAMELNMVFQVIMYIRDGEEISVLCATARSEKNRRMKLRRMRLIVLPYNDNR
jgi:hypothetical protein